MNMMENETKEACNDCKNLFKADRHTQPHKNLKHLESKRISSIMGAADESYYECKKCEYKWLHETGSCGMGWINQENMGY